MVANSAGTRANAVQGDKVIKEDLAEGNFQRSTSPPDIISALNAVEKPNGDITLILGCSRQIMSWAQQFKFNVPAVYIPGHL
ncbi:hypothetical protein BaRGS_00011332 [Batillaria attramentaria]|uniref:Uncharacterized protein n=1 Tax=Batillaria attramentaria TaxID=370345 RepID=A0ABD0LDM4_9CAEN